MSSKPEASLHDLKIQNEPFMTFLMPLSLIVFLTSRLREPDSILEHILFFAGYQWVLSLKNVVIGPLRQDTGLVSWALTLLATYFRHRWAMIILTAIVSLSNTGLFMIISSKKPWHNGFRKTSEYFKKSTFWAKTFWLYLLGSGVIWGMIARDLYTAPAALFAA